MRRSRVVLVVLASLAGLLVVAAGMLYGLARLDWFERQASSRLSARLGWPVEIDELIVGYFPLPTIEAGGLVIREGTATDAPPLLTVSRLRVVLPWRTMLGRGSHVARLELTGPQLTLTVDADGRGNWEPFVEHVAKLGGDGPASWSLGHVVVEEGGLTWGRAGASPDVTITGMAVRAEDVRPATPFAMDLRLAGHAGSQTFHGTAAGRVLFDPERALYAADELVLAGWIGGDDLPLAGVDWAATARSVRVEPGGAQLRGFVVDALGVHAELDLDVALPDGGTEVTFALATGAFSPRAAALGAGRPLPETTDPGALSRAHLQARGRWQAQELTVDSLQGEFDDTQFSGSVRLPAAGGVPVLRLALDALDLDRYLPPDDPTAPTTPQGALQALLAGLEAVDLDAEIRIAEAQAAGVRASGLRVVLTPLIEEGAR